jgi:hypothetical protein
MRVGHINLAQAFNSGEARFVMLVEALQNAGVQQHVLVRDTSLARRLAAIEGVTVGPVVHSPIMAYCLLPQVDIAHAHDLASGHAGLLLTLTRSIPYVLTHRGTIAITGNPLPQAIYKRALSVLCQDESEVAVLRHWLPGLAADIVPDIERNASAAKHLRVYQNSQRKPIAGSSGIQ